MKPFLYRKPCFQIKRMKASATARILILTHLLFIGHFTITNFPFFRLNPFYIHFALEVSLHSSVTYALSVFRDMHDSSGSVAEKVTDPDKTKLVEAETSFVLLPSVNGWHQPLFS